MSQRRKRLKNHNSRTPIVRNTDITNAFVAAIEHAQKKGLSTAGMQFHVHVHEGADKVNVDVQLPRTRFQKIMHAAGAPVRIVDKILKRPVYALLAFAAVSGATYFNANDPAQAGFDKSLSGAATEILGESVKDKYGAVMGVAAKEGAKVVNELIEHHNTPAKPVATAKPANP